MSPKILYAALALILLATGLSSAKDSPDQKREKTRKMAAQTLQDLYKLQPPAQAAIQKAAGYAVFDNMNVNLLVMSTAHGGGVAVNSSSKEETEGLPGDLRIRGRQGAGTIHHQRLGG